MLCPNDRKEMKLVVTEDEDLDGRLCFHSSHFYCEECGKTVYDWDDSFEYPDDYDEQVDKILKRS